MGRMQLGKEEGGMTEQPCPCQPCGVPAEGVPGQRFLLLSWFQCCGSVLTGGERCEGECGGEGDGGGIQTGLGALGHAGAPHYPQVCGRGGELGLISFPGCSGICTLTPSTRTSSQLWPKGGHESGGLHWVKESVFTAVIAALFAGSPYA